MSYGERASAKSSVEHVLLKVETISSDPDASLTEAEREVIDRKLLWKLDWMLMPWLCFLYLLCFLDRANIGNAKIANMTEELNMSSSDYNATLSIFFVAYAVFEALSNFLLKRLRPSIFIPIIIILWGVSMLGMGFVKDWNGLMAARFFLGMTEAGLFPGINYYLSCWYRRRELAVRAAIFFSAAALSGSFGGLLAAAIQNMDGLGGLSGWRWIFVIEALITIVAGFASFWIVQDFPNESKFLQPDDRARVLRRLRLDCQQSAGHEDFRMAYLWSALLDWKTYLAMFVYMGPVMPLYSFSLFLPTIIKNMGFGSNQSIVKNQLLCVPPYAAATILTVIMGLMSDRQNRRGIYSVLIAPVGIIGFVLMMTTSNAGIQYVGTFLGAMGIYPAVPIVITWVANNIEGVYKRGIVLGLVIGWGNLNGIVSSNIWYDQKHRFVQGHATVIGYLAICLLGGSLLLEYLLRQENARRRAGKRDIWIVGKTEKEIAMLGDKRPDFIYTL